jgi:preprotein translocase subunit SecE
LGGKSIVGRVQVVRQFLKEAKVELKKVTWPSKKDAIAGTVVVLITVFICAIFLGIVDFWLSKLMRVILS